MAYQNHTRTAQAGLALEISATVHRLIQAAHDRRAYRKTVRELSRLDDQTLADLGMHRSGIRAAAHKTVYGV